MYRIFAVALLALVSGCATMRTLDAPPYVQLTEPPVSTSWRLTNLVVSPPDNTEVSGQEFTALLQQLEGHLSDALTHEPALGAYRPTLTEADYAVEVKVRYLEGQGVNGWYGVGLGSAVAGPLTGGALALVATGAVASAAPVVAGALLGGGIALAAQALLPGVTHRGQLEAEAIVRRAKDGVEVARRSARSDWSAKVNRFNAEHVLATAAGSAVPKLERELSRQLRGVFESLPPPGRLAAAYEGLPSPTTP